MLGKKKKKKKVNRAVFVRPGQSWCCGRGRKTLRKDGTPERWEVPAHPPPLTPTCSSSSGAAAKTKRAESNSKTLVVPLFPVLGELEGTWC